MLFAPKTKFGRRLYNNSHQNPKTSFYELTAITAEGEKFDFQQLKGKKVLIVNTASDCGFTAQLAELQKLQTANESHLQIIAFPSNEFKNQEKLTDSEIVSYCKNNYRITFPIMAKTRVVKGKDQNEVFQWLTFSRLNGWNDHAPDWNFSKYLVDENGTLISYGGPAIPASEMLLKIQ